MSGFFASFLFGAFFAYMFFVKETVLRQLATFSIKKCACFCCDNNHTLDNGTRISCDRVLVEEHIVRLHGTSEKFDEFVRGPLHTLVKNEIGSDMFQLPLLAYSVLFTGWVLMMSIEGNLLSPDTWGSTSWLAGATLEPISYKCLQLLTNFVVNKCCRMAVCAIGETRASSTLSLVVLGLLNAGLYLFATTKFDEVLLNNLDGGAAHYIWAGWPILLVSAVYAFERSHANTALRRRLREPPSRGRVGSYGSVAAGTARRGSVARSVI